MRYYVRHREGSHVAGPFNVEELKAQMEAKRLSHAHVVLLENGQTPEQLQNIRDFRWRNLSNVLGQDQAGMANLIPQRAVNPHLKNVGYDPSRQYMRGSRRRVKAYQEKRAQRDMTVGGLWFFGGLAVTVFTYLSSAGGGTYVVAWGAILFGGIQFFRGVLSK
ncbi:MAG: hypothetical protein OJI67_11040 [Prosthecobacter sp.]|nr:hypothetical protein [Prosthecobacter sp.]